VSDEENRDALLAEGANEGEELGDLVLGKGGGGLVHDEDADLEGDGLGDLDGLLRGEGEAACLHVHVQAHAQPGEDLFRVGGHLAPVDDGAAVRMADEDVLGDVEVGVDHGFLVDGRDALHLGLLRVADVDGPAVEEDLAGIRAVDAGHDLDEGGFTRAVLADEGMDFSAVEGEGDVVQGHRGVEALGDMAHFH